MPLRNRNLILIPACMLALGLTNMAWGQAYCKLRDPVNSIKKLYPMATTYRSIVRTVDSSARDAVASAIPFKLHFNELGRHTLYVAMNKKKPVGLVHARSEKGRWGLVEIAWALDFDLRVRSFTFQRCRSPHRAEVESKVFKKNISQL